MWGCYLRIDPSDERRVRVETRTYHTLYSGEIWVTPDAPWLRPTPWPRPRPWRPRVDTIRWPQAIRVYTPTHAQLPHLRLLVEHLKATSNLLPSRWNDPCTFLPLAELVRELSGRGWLHSELRRGADGWWRVMWEPVPAETVAKFAPIEIENAKEVTPCS